MVTAPPSSLMLLDAATVYFRAFFGVPEKITAPDGTPINAVRGFLDIVARLITERRPARLVAAWDDDWRPQFRVAAVPSYKAHRVDPATGGEEIPPTLAAQIPIIVDVLAAFGIARTGAEGHEADDVIGTLIAREVDMGRRGPVEILTGDKDLFQLVDDAAQVRVLFMGRGLSNLDEVDEARLQERFGVTSGAQYADLAVLVGDPSDGLPGVAGIGAKTAAALLAQFGDLAGITTAVANGEPGVTPAQRKRIEAAADYLAVAPKVVRVARAAPVPQITDALPKTPADPAALAALADRWGIGSSVQRMTAALANAATLD